MMRLLRISLVLVPMLTVAGGAEETRRIEVLADTDGHHLARQVAVTTEGSDEPQVLFFRHGGDLQPGVIKLRSLHRAGGYLGVQLVDLTAELRAHFGAPEECGIMVARVAAGSPAARAGIEVGDILTRADGKPLASSLTLRQRVRRKQDGETLELEAVRDGRQLLLAPTLVVSSAEPLLAGSEPHFRMALADCEEGEECDLEWVCEEEGCAHLMEPEILEGSMGRLQELLESGELPRVLRAPDPDLEKRLLELERQLREMARELERQQRRLEEQD